MHRNICTERGSTWSNEGGGDCDNERLKRSETKGESKRDNGDQRKSNRKRAMEFQ